MSPLNDLKASLWRWGCEASLGRRAQGQQGCSQRPAGLRRALDEATGWYQLTYQVNRPPDGAVHDLEMKLRRPGVAVKTTRVVTAATSESQAEARARRLLGGVDEDGELRVDLALGPATAGDDKHLEALYHVGAVLAKLKRYAHALAAWKRVIAIDPSSRLAQQARRHMRSAEDLNHIFRTEAA